ncbi:hypothetical protein [Nostoc sphaeroides]|uniref:hypothetical protein n=1 Tax=Nostoc sphaeroides TaxID=446679 RepID=UPI002B4000DC|nr:hypothetical protein [Nostoc sphaeroides]
MLTLEAEQTSALDYTKLNNGIQDTFAAIDRFEWQAIDELRLMLDNHYYQDGGHVSFEDYCESELTKHGGYRRVKDLFAAKRVVDTLPEELRPHITKPSQTRSLLRLVKTPDKLEQAVAISQQKKNPSPLPQTSPKQCSKSHQQLNAPQKAKTQKRNCVILSQFHNSHTLVMEIRG